MYALMASRIALDATGMSTRRAIVWPREASCGCDCHDPSRPDGSEEETGLLGGPFRCDPWLGLPGDPARDERRDRAEPEAPSEPIPERRLSAGGDESEHHDDAEEQVVDPVASHARESTHCVSGTTGADGKRRGVSGW